MCQTGKPSQGRDIAYLVRCKIEPCKASETRQQRNVAYVVTSQVEFSQPDAVLETGEILDAPLLSIKLGQHLQI